MGIGLLALTRSFSSDLLHVGAKHNINHKRVGGARLNKAALQLALPNRFDPLTNSVKRPNVFQQSVHLRRLERELDNLFLATVQVALGHITVKV